MQDLGIEDLEQIYAHHRDDETDLGEAFAERFDSRCRTWSTLTSSSTIIASELDPTSDRIVEFLAESYGVPINAVFFRHFSDGDRQYLARTWLLDPQPRRRHYATAIPPQEPALERPRLLLRARPSRPADRWSIAQKVRAPKRRRGTAILKTPPASHTGQARVRIRTAAPATSA